MLEQQWTNFGVGGDWEILWRLLASEAKETKLLPPLLHVPLWFGELIVPGLQSPWEFYHEITWESLASVHHLPMQTVI